MTDISTTTDIAKLQANIAREWNRGHYTAVLKALREVPKDFVLELLIVCSDAVSKERRAALLNTLGFTAEDGAGDVLNIFEL